MLRNVLIFLAGCFCVAVVLYVCQAMLPLIGLPGELMPLAHLFIALGAIIALFYLAYRVFFGGAPPAL